MIFMFDFMSKFYVLWAFFFLQKLISVSCKQGLHRTDINQNKLFRRLLWTCIPHVIEIPEIVWEISNTCGRTGREIPIGKLISEIENTEGEWIGTAFGILVYFMKAMAIKWDTRGRTWLRHCDTSRKVAGSIPDGAIGIFH